MTSIEIVHWESGVAIVSMARLLSEHGVREEAKTPLRKAIEDSPHRPLVVLDYDGVTRLTSAMLGAIMAINLRVKRMRGFMRIARLNPDLTVAFSLVKLDKIVPIDDDLASSIERARASNLDEED